MRRLFRDTVGGTSVSDDWVGGAGRGHIAGQVTGPVVVARLVGDWCVVVGTSGRGVGHHGNLAVPTPFCPRSPIHRRPLDHGQAE